MLYVEKYSESIGVDLQSPQGGGRYWSWRSERKVSYYLPSDNRHERMIEKNSTRQAHLQQEVTEEDKGGADKTSDTDVSNVKTKPNKQTRENKIQKHLNGKKRSALRRYRH